MFDCLCPQRQGRATINAKTLTLYLLEFTKSSGDGGLYCTWTDRHTTRHRHMLERVSLPFESVCWNQRWNQRYDNLAAKPRRQRSALSGLLYRFLQFTRHVLHLNTHTHSRVLFCPHAHFTHSTRTNTHTNGGSNALTSDQKASLPPSFHCRSRRACGRLLVSL